MRTRPLLLRDVLLLTIGSLTLLIALLIGQDVYAEWQKLAKMHALKEATLLGDQLFEAAEKLSVERDIVFSMLHASGKESMDDLGARLAESQRDVDQAMGAATEEVKRYGFQELADQLDEGAAQFGELRDLRHQVNAAVALPVAKRDPVLSQRWFDVSTALILQTQNLWMHFIKHFANIDSSMALHMRFKHILGIIMEYSGRQRSMIGRLLADNADPTPEEQAQLLRWQGTVETGWSIGDTLADQGALYPSIAPFFQDAKSHYFTVYDMMRDIFYVPGAHHGASYPISVEFWLDLASQTTDSLNTLKDAALKKTRDYVELLEARAQRSIFYHFTLLLCVLALCAYSFRTVIYRVIRPVNSMVEALVSATEGKPVSIEPPTYSRQDEIGKLAFVLHVFQQNVDEVKRTSAALGESESKLYQAQKMEAIGNLTGGMAHDFNNLLGIVIGNLDLLLEHVEKNEQAQQLAQAAIDAALRGADLTRRLLAFARQQPLQPQRIEINQLVEGITKLLSRTLGENIEISLELAPGIWPTVADPAQLEAAITNLATNARDAMPEGGKLIISTLNGQLDADYAAEHTDVRPGDYAVIEVSDTGTGMPPEVVNRIFEPFFTTKERGKGTGLGLAMVFGFLKQSGGHVNVYSEVGAGTTFRLYLPRTATDAAETVQISTPTLAVGGHETILVVEDNEAMRKVVSRQLGELGYHVLEAGNASAALEMLTAGDRVDLLFTDIVMPGKLDGLGLAREVTARWPALKVVLTSGFPESKLNGQNEPVTGIRLLSKPYRKEELARVIRETLENGAKKHT